MSKRHWLRDEIDFGEEPHGAAGPREEHVFPLPADECDYCNSAAREIADSLALYNVSLRQADNLIYWDALDRASKSEFGIF